MPSISSTYGALLKGAIVSYIPNGLAARHTVADIPISCLVAFVAFQGSRGLRTNQIYPLDIHSSTRSSLPIYVPSRREEIIVAINTRQFIPAGIILAFTTEWVSIFDLATWWPRRRVANISFRLQIPRPESTYHQLLALISAFIFIITDLAIALCMFWFLYRAQHGVGQQAKYTVKSLIILALGTGLANSLNARESLRERMQRERTLDGLSKLEQDCLVRNTLGPNGASLRASSWGGLRSFLPSEWTSSAIEASSFTYEATRSFGILVNPRTVLMRRGPI
ncbi:hypothetical protein GLOTRDRAFT_89709 [Gloeophyllum trabeum ATCC 11539]|uniref:Uncharacterized protein n=1 Tax=Gloeophyllum trabeum (strain ATCC 11539 / FP-39264 / Madison 617) TaxID=670483 RepID=S7QK38_GLOTA|nr:uncharacterized protein GLOTRDRAFT_89709 [Gloeophyllum trabeum ATCC 11539]EPQ60096.1 hypothetical protein GLOTRDRAFT_89709 [Gloeophyllum trabeum ATCC 11539]